MMLPVAPLLGFLIVFLFRALVGSFFKCLHRPNHFARIIYG
jgi:hypothetical protein